FAPVRSFLRRPIQYKGCYSAANTAWRWLSNPLESSPAPCAVPPIPNTRFFVREGCRAVSLRCDERVLPACRAREQNKTNGASPFRSIRVRGRERQSDRDDDGRRTANRLVFVREVQLELL